jgi:hypothetical protein
MYFFSGIGRLGIKENLVSQKEMAAARKSEKSQEKESDKNVAH